MSVPAERVAIIGAGLTGNLLAIYLAGGRRRVTVFERNAALGSERGRSINLALAERGIAALKGCGIFDAITPLTIGMRGRMIHQLDRQPWLARYGQNDAEMIFSISRAALNRKLAGIAQRRRGVEYRFATSCLGIDEASGMPLMRSADGEYVFPADTVLAADGAGSVVREALRRNGQIHVAEERLDHAYKELTIAPGPTGDYALDPHALHVWPRGGYMLIALPNTDRSFTATLFLPLTGEPSFATLTAARLEPFLRREFPDTLALLDSPARQFEDHPTGTLGTIRCTPWSDRRRYLLIGDAAHAIVPFHGQGMNAAFEDVVAIASLLGTDDNRRVFERFELQRRANADAIADMALENYIDMRDGVRADDFELRRAVGFELERRFPGRFIPRYSMVMFHPEISYAEAQRRGAAQELLLDRLTNGVTSVEQIDFRIAAAELAQVAGSP